MDKGNSGNGKAEHSPGPRSGVRATPQRQLLLVLDYKHCLRNGDSKVMNHLEVQYKVSQDYAEVWHVKNA